MSIFDFEDYKAAVNAWIKQQSHNGHGQLSQMSQHLKVNSVVMTQVFRGDRDLTLEQAMGVATYMGFNDNERNYLLLLVQQARAGTTELRKVFAQQASALRKSSSELKNRLVHSPITDEVRGQFYSHWSYTAIRQGISIPRLGNVNEVAAHLSLERAHVAKVVDFLVTHGLLKIEKKGFSLGQSVTHVGHDSPHVNRHHSNWRLRGLHAMDQHREGNLFYTGPMAISTQTAHEIRSLLVSTVEAATKKAGPSPSEELHCLGIDWFSV